MKSVYVKICIILSALLFFSAACNTIKGVEKQTNSCPLPYSSEVMIGNKNLCVETVSTAAKKNKGLSGRKSMDQKNGMLFDFTADSNSQPGFWMKDMQFDLDLLWIKNNHIVEITKNVAAPKTTEENLETNLKVYYPSQSVDQVLEVNAGWSEKNNIMVNQKIDRK
jgi:uncharacterized membrane protein (UPF0127 family)/predicted small secreted protein